MKINILLFVCLAILADTFSLNAQEPLRVFIRAGKKTHGPDQHDHPRFLKEWTQLLNERGARAEGSMDFPTSAQLEKTDVLVVYAADGMKIVGDERSAFEKYLKRGGGLVVIHDGVVSGDQNDFAKKVQGGSWVWANGKTKWHEGEVGIYFVDTTHPITSGISNFDWKDEIYHDLDMDPEAHVLATSFHSVFVIAPQLWTYEKAWDGSSEKYRAFVSLPGHEYAVFNTPHYRSILLRGIAWAGKRSNVDLLCKKEELSSLKYPEGGPTAPEKAASRMNVHPDFSVNLVASEPLIEKAISIDWDAKGRLWVAETPEYPGGRTINQNDAMVALWNEKNPEKIKPGQKEDRPAKDRISWLEDTDGDGRMDRKTVFADGLELVTSMVFYKDGVIVAQAPDILWLRDLNGDGRCDMEKEKVVLYSGFGTMDTHAVINNFRWGFDGWIYSAVGYSAGEPKTPDGKKSFGRITAGVIRFKPDGSALEQYVSGSCNTWGFDFAPDGEAFYTTATCGEHFLHVVMPEKDMARGNVGGVRSSSVVPDHQKIFPSVHHTRPAYVQIDLVGQFTATAGCCMYNGGAWPSRYTGSHFCSETTMSLVHNEFPKPKGVSYVAGKETGREEAEFIASTDLWFRPIHSRVGPDGALYVVDFYNQAAIHNDTRGPKHGARNAAVRPDRDHHFGRIWRVQHKQAEKLPASKLNSKNATDWVKALDHPNGWVRGTAQRLLTESGEPKQVPALNRLVDSGTTYGKMMALWSLHQMSKLEAKVLLKSIDSEDLVIRKAALKIAAEPGAKTGPTAVRSILARLNDSDARVKLQALLALAGFPVSAEVTTAIVEAYPGLNDKHLESAALGVTAKDPLAFLAAAFDSSNAGNLSAFAGQLAKQAGNAQNPELASALVKLIASKEPSTDRLKQVVLASLAASLKVDVVPAWSGDLKQAFSRLLTTQDPEVPGAALPLIARWDATGELSADLQPQIKKMMAQLSLSDLGETQRTQLAVNLLGVRKMHPSIVPELASLLSVPGSVVMQKRIIEAFGSAPDMNLGEVLINEFSGFSPDLKDPALTQILKRSEWTLALLKAVEDKKINLPELGAGSVHRLRTHPDKNVAKKANEVIDEIRGPEQKEKDALIAQFAAVAQQPGNIPNGKTLFTQNCSSCHKFKGEGRELAPDLTGMGAHGAMDLLVHILDPNRLVEPNFISYNFETKDDQSLEGVIARENQSVVVLRNAAGDVDVRVDNIKSRRATGLSLMPNGFEVLGGEGLRDLIGYLCADENKYRILDLSKAFTANTSRGIFNSLEARDESLRFRKFGVVKLNEIPFEIVNPTRTLSGNNVTVLKGGFGLAKTYPQKVELQNVNLKASRLHFLGGVGGWAHPYGENSLGIPVAKVLVRFHDNTSEEFVLKNGVEFADYNGTPEVPGSKFAPDLVATGRQVRWFSRDLMAREPIQSISLESFDNRVAPVFVAITAEVADGGGSHGVMTAARSVEATGAQGAGKRILTIGGNSSHDFEKWFNLADAETLTAAGFKVAYTEQMSEVEGKLTQTDLLYLSNNQPFPVGKVRSEVFDFSKKGLLLVHAALWYSWKDWPEYNAQLVGGGTRSHDKFGSFEVTIVDQKHPLTQGVEPQFSIVDELYHFEKDPAGSNIHVLATGKSPVTGKVFPVMWTTELPGGKVVCLTLGHDGKAHEHPAYQKLLVNSCRWLSN